MKNQIFRFLKNYSTEPIDVDRLIISAYLVKNGLAINKNQLLNAYLISPHNEAESKKATNVVKGSYQRYVLTRERLAEYILANYGMQDIPLGDINHNFIKGFDLWNRTQHENGNNTAARFVKHFRTMYNMALNNGWVHVDPFANYKIKLEKVNRGYLTQEEIDILYNKPMPSSRLELVRDIFIFSCYTGFAYIDVFQLSNDNVLYKEDGTVWLVTARQKTNVPLRVRLLSIPLAIVEKYKGQSKNNKLLPVPSNQKDNDYLKEIGGICGFEKTLTFHLARHTFATTVTLENGVPIETVSKLLGHISVKTTQIYARITDRKIDDAFDVLSEKIDKRQAFAMAQASLQ